MAARLGSVLLPGEATKGSLTPFVEFPPPTLAPDATAMCLRVSSRGHPGQFLLLVNHFRPLPSWSFSPYVCDVRQI